MDGTTAEQIPKQEVFKPQDYFVEGSKVQVRWSETTPKENKNLDPQRGIVWVSAWNWLPEAGIIKNISQKVADHSEQRVFTVSSKTDRLGPDASFTEAKGLAQFIKDHNLSEVIIAGHSEGGMKAVDLVAALQQNNPDIKIDGLVLMDSMGLYDQDPKDLRKNFVDDSIKVAPDEFKAAGVNPPSMTASFMQMAHGIWEDIKFFKHKFPQKFAEEISAMARANPRLKDIKAPVLIITGKRDYVSDYRGYLPQEEVKKRLDHVSDSSAQGQMFEQGRARKKYLEENMFPNAENVATLVLSKGGHHAGVTDIRINQAAYVISRIFERMRRPANTA